MLDPSETLVYDKFLDIPKYFLLGAKLQFLNERSIEFDPTIVSFLSLSKYITFLNIGSYAPEYLISIEGNAGLGACILYPVSTLAPFKI